MSGDDEFAGLVGKFKENVPNIEREGERMRQLLVALVEEALAVESSPKDAPQHFVEFVVDEWGRRPFPRYRIQLLQLLYNLATGVEEVTRPAQKTIVELVQSLWMDPAAPEVELRAVLDGWRKEGLLDQETMDECERREELPVCELLASNLEQWKRFNAPRGKNHGEVNNLRITHWVEEMEEFSLADLPAPVTKPIPTKYKVNASVVPSFIEGLTAKITEAIVDHPGLTKRLGEVLAHATTIDSAVAKAERLRELHQLLGDLTAERLGAQDFEMKVEAMLPSAPAEGNEVVGPVGPVVPIVDKIDADEEVLEEGDGDVDDEYDPLAAFEEGVDPADQPDAEGMDPDTMLYLPQPLGRASCTAVAPPLGPRHVLSRVFYPSPNAWVAGPVDRTHCEAIRVFFVRRSGDSKASA